jgi:hypothetical protein
MVGRFKGMAALLGLSDYSGWRALAQMSLLKADVHGLPVAQS